MPVPSKYLSGFGIKKGMILAGYRLIHIGIDENTVQKYKRYQYPARFTFELVSEQSSSPQKLLSTFNSRYKSDRTIYTRWGNPYRCALTPGTIKSSHNGGVVIYTKGSCFRVYE